MEKEGHPTPLGYSPSSCMKAPQEAVVLSWQQFLFFFPALSLLSGSSSEWWEVIIYFTLIFPTSELATKLNGSLTFFITICLIDHLVPFSSAHQVLKPATNPWIPVSSFGAARWNWSTVWPLTIKQIFFSAPLATRISEQCSPVEGGHAVLAARSPFLWKSSKAILLCPGTHGSAVPSILGSLFFCDLKNSVWWLCWNIVTIFIVVQGAQHCGQDGRAFLVVMEKCQQGTGEKHLTQTSPPFLLLPMNKTHWP